MTASDSQICTILQSSSYVNWAAAGPQHLGRFADPSEVKAPQDASTAAGRDRRNGWYGGPGHGLSPSGLLGIAGDLSERSQI